MPIAPFILLDDARAGAASDGGVARLYQAPVHIVRADTLAQVAPALVAIRDGVARGLHAAGYLSYEAGAAFEAGLKLPDGAGPLLWFGLFAAVEEIPADTVPAMLGDPAGAWNGVPEPMIDRATYDARIAQVKALIAAGDIYQANLTYAARVPVAGDPRALYARLRRTAAAGYGAYIDTGTAKLLSFSPELFFSLEQRTLTARPMKGTARRDADPVVDAARATALAQDPKQRAENLMIVDLMRNDLARVAMPGSVAVPALFEVEGYPTVHQMVSTVTATLPPMRDAIDVIAALFPCGSITGAPKIRAMEALAEIEGTPRGLYTGAIGRIDPDGSAMFNVAIRSLTLMPGADHAILGVGGGIVAESTAADEWDETIAKGAFLLRGRPRFDLIETMAFDPMHGIALLEGHLARMRASAAQFGIAFDRHSARNELQAATFRLTEPRKVRLLLSQSGALAIEIAPLPPPPAVPVPVAIAPLPVSVADFRLRHKTTDRGFYDDARLASGAFEVAFTDPQGFLTEGSFTALFVARGDMLVTPPLARGLLPGVLRDSLLTTGRAIEGDLTPADLDNGFFIGNAVRGLIPAVVAPPRPPRL